MFHDRLFSQLRSDDAPYDRTFSSHTVVLNMLCLTLHHSELDVGEGDEEEVGVVVRTDDAARGLSHAKG
ncbi:hypothetical protein AX14_001143 [Amanita brunnescens Koide BX004]|nr:hypothetical protein AX14_001143 [Amanita brunnescens Koide BX004]